MKLNNILVLYKESNYKLQRREVEEFGRGHPLLTGVKSSLMREHGRHYRSLDEITDILNGQKLNYSVISRGKKISYSDYDCVITIGGDGTFLEATRFIEDQFLVGVNSAPDSSVGKFCLTDARHFESHLKKILRGQIKPTKLYKLQGRMSGSGKEIYALNDILICHHNPAAMSRYGVEISGKREIHKSSGIWIATSAGSTGAVKSAGGKSMKVGERRMQYKPRELCQSKNFKYQLKGGILAEDQSIKITSIMKGARIFVDGAHVCEMFPYGMTISIKMSKKTVKAYLKNK